MKPFKFEQRSLSRSEKAAAVVYLLIFAVLVAAALLRALGVTEGEKPDFFTWFLLLLGLLYLVVFLAAAARGKVLSLSPVASAVLGGLLLLVTAIWLLSGHAMGKHQMVYLIVALLIIAANAARQLSAPRADTKEP